MTPLPTTPAGYDLILEGEGDDKLDVRAGGDREAPEELGPSNDGKCCRDIRGQTPSDLAGAKILPFPLGGRDHRARIQPGCGDGPDVRTRAGRECDVPDDDSLAISIPNDLREVPGTIWRIDRLCVARGLTPGVAYLVNMSLDELLTNIIVHDCGDDELHRIDIDVRFDGEALVVVISDDGAPFDPTLARNAATCREDLAWASPGRLFIDHVMDGIEYRREAERNVVTLVKDTGGTER